MPGGGSGKPTKPKLKHPESDHATDSESQKQEAPDPKRVQYENKYKKRYKR